MARRSVTNRVEILEQTVGELKVLPARVAAVEEQILQLRGEMHGGFSAIDRRFEAIDRRFDAVDRRLDAHDQRLDSIDRKLDAHDRRFDHLDESIEATRRDMRILHEEVLARISLLQEGRGPE